MQRFTTDVVTPIFGVASSTQAAMFNFTEITFILMDSGADLLAKNAQGKSLEAIAV